MKQYTEAPVPQELATARPDAVQEALWGAAVELNLPIACWRLPETDQIFVAVALQQEAPVQEPALEESRPGFCFCPFAASEEEPNLHIAADLIYESAANRLYLHTSTQSSVLAVDFLKTVQKRLAKNAGLSWHLPQNAAHLPEIPDGQYVELVKKCVAHIKAGHVEKLVPSRCKPVNLPQGFSLFGSFRKLLHRYPHAFASLVAVPGIGTWMGATPETIVEIDKNQIFKTMALAGTQKFRPGHGPEQALWGQKEIEEQRMVERYIINCFKKIRLREYTEDGPRTVVAGNLMHLRTDLTADLKTADYPAVGTDMLRLLHPTSAVSGMPREEALQFMLQEEGYNRSYYSGFLGPVKIQGETHIYVNLRCLQLLQHQAVLYAGAGVTAGSDPEKELAETALKMETMLAALID